MGWGIEKIYYDGLLNHKVLDKTFLKLKVLLFISCVLLSIQAYNGVNTFIVIIGTIALICGLFVTFPKRYKEKSETRKLVTFYNDCIKNNNCIEVDEDLRNEFIVMSKDTILNKLQTICEPEFIYDDETKVYKVEHTSVTIVNGYFKDNSVSRTPKRKYVIVYINGEFYMCCIDNLICWEKGTYFSRFYNKTELKSNKVDYIKW